MNVLLMLWALAAVPETTPSADAAPVVEAPAPAVPAQPTLAPAPTFPPPRGAFVGDSWRYRQREQLLGVGALVDGAEPLVEASALALEALAVIQVYHLSLKFLTGREGPLARDGRGEYFGPTRINFPDGTPSGHSATMFAIAGVYALYFDSLVLRVLLLGSAAIAASFLVVDDSHFASEVIVGSLMGFLTARWVVEHRSSRYRYGEKGLPLRLVGVGPLAVTGSGAAVAATFRF